MVSRPVFSLPIRVYIEDTDAGGIVFHAKYLHYMERARTEWLRSLGISLRAGLGEDVNYVVQQLDIRYLMPARLDDLLRTTAALDTAGRASFVFHQQVIRDRDDQLLAEARVRVACVGFVSGRPRRLPSELQRALAEFQSDSTKHQN